MAYGPFLPEVHDSWAVLDSEVTLTHAVVGHDE